jgi:hypothetical protein
MQKGGDWMEPAERPDPLTNASDGFRKAMPNATSNWRAGHGELGNPGSRAVQRSC